MPLKTYREIQTDTAKKTAVTSLIMNTIFALSKGIGGILGNSFALIAEAIESLSDVFASILVFFGIKYAVRPPDENHPYGHGKLEPLVTFVIVGILICSSVTIAYHAIDNLNEVHKTPKIYTIFILIAVVIAKELMYRFVEKKGDETQSTSLKAEAWHHRSDAISSFIALIGISFAIFGGKGFEKADDIAAIITAIVILINAYLIFRPALGEIMDEDTYPEMAKELRKFTKIHFPDTETEKIHIRKNGMFYYVDFHLMVSGTMTVTDSHKLGHDVKDKIIEFNESIGNVLIHIEPVYEKL